MKYLPALLVYFFQNKATKRNFVNLAKFFGFLATVVLLYSILFHLIMLYEGRNHSWITGFYWTLTVMSTLGFGDITFKTDLGMFFTILVLVSGVVFLLIMLPFTFIQFFYAPWLEAQEKTRTPRELPEDTENHIIITSLDPITAKLVKKLDKYNYQYVIVEADIQKALELHDMGYKVVLGAPDDSATYERLQIHRAAIVVATNDDLMNTNISFTVREITDKVPIITNANHEHSIDILEFPGNTHVFQFMKMLGVSLGLRTLGVNVGTTVMGRFGRLLVAEFPAMHTKLVTKTLVESRLREQTGITVVGLWEQGVFKIPFPDTTINSGTVLVLAGTKEQLQSFDGHFAITCNELVSEAPVLILGGGRVGRATAATLDEHGIRYRIVEKRSTLVKKNDEHFIEGDGADINTLKKAGIDEARSVIITTHNDAMNIYLTFYCRQLRSDIQIISRSVEEQTVSKLHRAGADVVMSYATMGANAILNFLQPDDVSVFTEGLTVFSRTVHHDLVGKSLAENQIRDKTGCSVIAINSDGKQIVSPDPLVPLKEGDELILIGTTDAEKSYLEMY